jgi:hypothetical protein
MTTWIDPTFGEATTSAGLIALGRVVDANPRGARVEVTRVFAGERSVGESVTIHRSTVVGRGHEASTLPKGETFAFVVRAGSNGAYEAFTDSFWTFAISNGDRVHMPIRDPFTRAYVLFDDLAELVRLMRDRGLSPAPFLARQMKRLGETQVAATQPIEVNDQIIALESLAHLGSADYTPAASPFLRSPHFQTRWSAVRALGTCGGPAATRSMLDQLAREDVPPVQAALAEAFFRLADVNMRDELQAALPRMFEKSMPYSRNLMSPIMNMMPSPRDTLSKVIAKLSGAPG